MIICVLKSFVLYFFAVNFNRGKLLEPCIESMSRRTKIKSGIKADVDKFKGKVENFTSGIFR